MNWKEQFARPNEQPLDTLVQNGGYCGILRTIGCIGDSLSSGEFEVLEPDGSKSYHDQFDYSWGQYLARMAGCKVYNFSRGGMTAEEYCESFADNHGYWNIELQCHAYILALGVNDMNRTSLEIGSLCDIHPEDYRQNRKTFVGYYAQIIQRLKKYQPNAKFFLMTMPQEPNHSQKERFDIHAQRLHELAEYFSNTYVLDFRKYAPVQDDEYKEKFYLHGHLNACGYMFTAQMVASYIDYIIRHHIDDFRNIGLVGTGHYPKED